MPSLERTASTWVTRNSNKNTEINRRTILHKWVVGNGLAPETISITDSLPIADQLVSDLKAGKYDVYDTADNMIKHMLKAKRSRYTIAQHRSVLPSFFKFCKLPFDNEDFKASVTKVKGKVESTKRILDPEQVRQAIMNATFKAQAIIETGISTGSRVNEYTQLLLSDIDFEKVPTHVHFRETITKNGDERYAFLSSEATEIVKSYLKSRPQQDSKWLFCGETAEQRLDPDVARYHVQKAFKRIGLDGRTWHNRHEYAQHGFRTLNLSIAKTNGFPPDWAEWMAGHDTGTKAHYLQEIGKIANEWLKKVEPHMHFLQPKAVTVVVPETTKEFLERLEAIEARLAQKDDQLANKDSQIKQLLEKLEAKERKELPA